MSLVLGCSQLPVQTQKWSAKYKFGTFCLPHLFQILQLTAVGTRHSVKRTGKILHQSFWPRSQSIAAMQHMTLTRPKGSPRMDCSQFSCSSPSCCSLSLKNTQALFVLERLFVHAFADGKYFQSQINFSEC